MREGGRKREHAGQRQTERERERIIKIEEKVGVRGIKKE